LWQLWSCLWVWELKPWWRIFRPDIMSGSFLSNINKLAWQGKKGKAKKET